MKRFYFDHAAATPMDPRVVKAMSPYYFDIFGNPGSIHKFGQEASAAVFKARNKISKLLNCDYREIIFTGSATEANNLAIRGVVKKFKERSKELPRIITSQIEHESILEVCREVEKEGLAEVIYLPVSKEGQVDLKKFKAVLNERTILVSIMYANNEIGSIQLIGKILGIIANYKQERSSSIFPLFHTDAVQAFNYLNCDVKELGVDMMTLSSQKIYGPKGVGFLYVKNFGSIEGEKFISPIIIGGGQEEGLRSGTENVAGIVGMSEAAQISFDLRKKECQRLYGLQSYFLDGLRSIKRSSFVLNGPKIGDCRLPNNINIYFKDKKDLVFKLDFAGFAVSGGSACSARLAKPSHVLKAIGCSDKKASESIRISFGRKTSVREIDRLISCFKEIV